VLVYPLNSIEYGFRGEVVSNLLQVYLAAIGRQVLIKDSVAVAVDHFLQIPAKGTLRIGQPRRGTSSIEKSGSTFGGHFPRVSGYSAKPGEETLVLLAKRAIGDAYQLLVGGIDEGVLVCVGRQSLIGLSLNER